jgi:RES domain-containing protein
MRRRLVRCVPALDFLEGSSPLFLYTSGRANRFNPPGVDCLYFSETERVALREYARTLGGTSAASGPKLTFIAEVDLRKVIDLGWVEVKRVLNVSTASLFDPWRDADSPTRLQQLGLAISRQREVSAIRYPSDACRRAGMKGWNIAIFPNAVALPSQLRIMGNSGVVLEELP